MIYIIVTIYVTTNSVSNKPTEKEFLISITESRNSASVKDQDNDGVPDWLEEIIDTDVTDSKSFPYRRDILLQSTLNVNDLVHAGPGGRVNDVIQKYVLDGGTTVTEKDKDEFEKLSVEYFTNEAASKALPTINLSVNESPETRKEVLNGIVKMVDLFKEIETPIEELILHSFGENDDYFSQIRDTRFVCTNILNSLHREIPSNLYTPYYAVLERMTYLCEALDISFRDRGPKTYFYVIKLLASGSISQEYLNTESQNSALIMVRNLKFIVDNI